MTNEHEEMANEFLNSTNTELKITKSAIVDRFWSDPERTGNRWRYRVQMKNARGKYYFYFYDSVNNYQKGIEPTAYDVLACLQKYDCGSFEDFCNEFGYEYFTYNEYRHVMKIYNAVKNEYEHLIAMFTDEEMERLCEIC